MKFLLASFLFHGVDAGLQLRNVTKHEASADQSPAFQSWYAAHTDGRGLWKWSASLDCYQEHLASMAGKKVALMEVGVQSGGSIKLWQDNLGAGCHYYGVDTDTRCTRFDDDKTKIFTGDQAQPAAWQHFFKYGMPSLNVAIDDGGHMPNQMLVTLQQVYPHMLDGGVYAVEDIHGQNDDYISKFFNPSADFLAAQGAAAVASVHLYPFMLVVRKPGGAAFKLPEPALTVKTLPELMSALPSHKGASVALANPSGGSLLTADSLKKFFAEFKDLHEGSVYDEPKNCYWACKEMACTMKVSNNEQQNLISSVHILPNALHVHVAAKPPSIHAARAGKTWNENVCAEKAPNATRLQDGYR